MFLIIENKVHTVTDKMFLNILGVAKDKYKDKNAIICVQKDVNSAELKKEVFVLSDNLHKRIEEYKKEGFTVHFTERGKPTRKS